MAISTRKLRSAASRTNLSKSRNRPILDSNKNLQTAFLSHSHKDHELAIGLQKLMTEEGWDVYIDWLDEELPSSPNHETASKIKSKIESNKLFLFLATENSTNSNWCPWEIGYADSVKGASNIIVIPTKSDDNKYYGNEYLQLYKRIDEGHRGNLSGYAVFEAGQQEGQWVRNIY